MMKVIDAVGKRVEIYKSKLLLFIAISGGSWVYVLKLDSEIFVTMMILVFVLSAVGVFINISKLSAMDTILKGFCHD